MKRMKAVLSVAGVAGLALVASAFFLSSQVPGSGSASGQPILPREPLRVGDARLEVEIADDPVERERGLSGRPGLAPGTGMLFRFPEPAIQPFWMKDMRFPLDILYLRDGQIRDVFADVPFPAASGTPAIVTPSGPADAVLEVQAGEATRRGWGVGTPVSGS